LRLKNVRGDVRNAPERVDGLDLGHVLVKAEIIKLDLTDACEGL
jgi:hypothetical protein